jgi:hypothetical protein
MPVIGVLVAGATGRNSLDASFYQGLKELTSSFLATRAKAGAGQNRRADGLEPYLAALAHRGEAFVLFLVHGAFPFPGPGGRVKFRSADRLSLQNFTR